MTLILETTHTPQGDGNLLIQFILLPPPETTHTPQGDGNSARSLQNSSFYRNNPHPARGRKPLIARGAACTLRKQPTPRKGTETAGALGLFYCQPETTHTPQGDGNRICGTVTGVEKETTHTPQGDGNQKTNARSFAITRNNPHPARGRKLARRRKYSD